MRKELYKAKAILKLVTGEDMYYGTFEEWMQAETILTEIKDKPFVKVTDKKGKMWIITLDKVIGCHMEKKRVF